MFAGSAFLAHFLPKTLLHASAPGYGQQTPSPADLLASMRAKFNAAPLETQRLAEDVVMFSGPVGSVVVLNGPDGKIGRGYPYRQLFSDDHHGCLENQTELDGGGGKRSNHQP
jgi:hypothetical protein